MRWYNIQTFAGHTLNAAGICIRNRTHSTHTHNHIHHSVRPDVRVGFSRQRRCQQHLLTDTQHPSRCHATFAMQRETSHALVAFARPSPPSLTDPNAYMHVCCMDISYRIVHIYTVYIYECCVSTSVLRKLTTPTFVSTRPQSPVYRCLCVASSHSHWCAGVRACVSPLCMHNGHTIHTMDRCAFYIVHVYTHVCICFLCVRLSLASSVLSYRSRRSIVRAEQRRDYVHIRVLCVFVYACMSAHLFAHLPHTVRTNQHFDFSWKKCLDERGTTPFRCVSDRAQMQSEKKRE